MQQLNVSTLPELTPSVITDTLQPFLSIHGASPLTHVHLGLLDAVHARVQRMICSLMDQYPAVHWHMETFMPCTQHPMLASRLRHKTDLCTVTYL